MKAILKTLVIACTLLLGVHTTYAQCGPGEVGQNIDIRFSNERLDCANDKLLVDIQLSNPTGADYTVGSMSLRFTFNTNMLDNPAIESDNGIGTHSLQVQTGIYSYGVVDFTGTNVLPASAAWTNVGTLEFDVINFNASTNGDCIDLSWNTSAPAITTIQQWYSFLCQPNMTFTSYGNNTTCIADSCIPVPLVLSAAITNETCSGTDDGAIDLSIVSGVAPYSITWSTGATTEDISSLAPGIYSVTVVDANGTTESLNALTVQANTLSPDVTIVDASCFSRDNGSITINSVTGGVAPYTFAWSTGAGNVNNIDALVAGTYGVTITDANGCVYIDDKLTVGQPGEFEYNVTLANVSCANGADGALDFSMTGGTAPYNFLWLRYDPNTFLIIDTLGTAEDQFNLEAGLYGLQVVDANGCPGGVFYLISEPPPIIISGIPTTEVTPVRCYGESTGFIDIQTSGGTGVLSYLWSNGAGSEDLDNEPAGTYSVTATDLNGCTATATFVITQPDSIIVSVNTNGTSDALCYGAADGSIDVTATGGTGPFSYDWSTGDTTEDVSGLTAGTYSLTVTDSLGCVDATFSLTINEPDSLTIAGTVTDVSCEGFANGSIDLSVSGGTPGYAYAWSNGDSTEDISGLAAGNFTVTVTDTNACFKTQTFTIGQPADIVITVDSITEVSCSGADDGAVYVSVAGGTPGYTYAWSNGDTTEDITGLAGGTYTITVTDANGCFDTISATVGEAPLLTVTLGGSTNVTCFGFTNGAIDINVGGGTPGYTYAWSNGDTTQDLSGIGAGSYTVTVTDSRGCFTPGTFTITQPDTLIASIASKTDASCNGFADGEIDVNVVGGTPAYSYAWSNGDTTQDISGLVAGTYTLTVTDANGCTDVTSATITEAGTLTIAVDSTTDVSCFGLADGAVDVTVSGGTTPYSYVWSNGDTTEDLTGLSAGSYGLTVTDANGCVANASTTVGQPDTLVASITSTTNASCFGFANGAIDVTVAGGTTAYDYAWSNGDTTEDLTGLTAGTYTLTVTDANGCTDVASATITEPDTLTITVDGSTDVSCFGFTDGSVNVTIAGGTPAYDFNWSNGDTTEDISGLGAGTYTLVVTDAQGCTATGSVTVNQPDTLVALVSATDDVDCFGDSTGSVTLTVTGGTTAYGFAWSNGAITQNLTNVPAGTYTVTVTDANGCTDVATATVGEAPLLTVSLGGSTNVSCNGFTDGAIDINVGGGTPGYDFAWSNSDTTEDLTGIGAGSYTVTVTDANGCTATGTYSITEPDVLALTLDNVTDVTCAGAADGSIDLGVTGGTPAYSYIWSTGDTTQDLSGLSQGTYSVTVTDANGCQDSTSATINEDSPLVVTVDSTSNVSCFGVADGSISVSVVGGTLPYSYAWSNGDSTATITNLGPGTYSVTVTDSSGCGDNVSVNITQPDSLTASLSVTNVTCAGGSDGAIDLTVAGGTAPFTYAWSNLATSEDLTGITEGIYSVVVTDANGCTATGLAGVNTLVTLVLNTGTTNATCGDDNGTASVTVSGGTGAYAYIWSNGETTALIDSLATGTYTVTVTDAQFGCTDEVTVVVGSTSDLVVTPTVVDVVCNGGATGSISVAVSGGTGAYTYAWTVAGSGSSITGLAAGTYGVTVTDDTTGCSTVLTATVSETSGITLTATAADATCGQNDGSVSVSPAGGTQPYTYMWNTGDTMVRSLNLGAGVYMVTVTDANGCTETASATVGNAGGPVVTIDSTIDLSCAGQADGAIDISVAGGTAPFTYAWSNGATTADISGLLAGPYAVTVTDSNGCEASAFATISGPTEIVIVADREDVTCSGLDDGTITLSTVTGGIPPYTYAWSNGPSTPGLTNLAPGTYTVTVTDANGCEASTPVVITEPESILLSTSITNVNCAGGSDGAIDLTATGGTLPYTYNWSNGATTEDLTGIEEGVYSVTVTDANGCFETTTVGVNTLVTLIPNTAVTNATCGDENGTATVSVSGGSGFYTYTWSNSETTATIDSLAAGTYTVIVNDTINGCTTTATVNVSSTDGFDLEANVIDATCGSDNGSIALTATGGSGSYTYVWSNFETTDSIGGLSGGTYSVTVTDTTNGCISTLTATVGETGSLALTPSSTNEDCGQGNGSASVSVSGTTSPYTYAWSNGAANASTGNLTAGVYGVTVTDVNGCTTSTTVMVGSNGGPTVTIDSITDLTCGAQTSGAIDISVTGGATPYTYEWSNGATTADINGLLSGSYAVTVTDASGCSAVAMGTVGTASPIEVEANYENVSCFEEDDASIDITTTGGLAPYTYQWSYRSRTTEDLEDLVAGTYTVTVTDANSCTVSTTIIITQPEELNFSATVVDATCAGGTDGSVDATVTGGTEPYTFSWSNGATTEDLSNMAPGFYIGHVTDANGCTANFAATVGATNTIVINTGVTNATCGESNGSAAVFISGGSAPYTFAWAGGDTTDAITDIAPGVYPITVTDANGCSNTENVVVEATSDIDVTVASNDPTCAATASGDITLTVTGGTAPYTYAWSNAAGNVNANTGLVAGTYNATVTDSTGCSSVVSVTLTEQSGIDFTASATPALCPNDIGTATVAPTGGTAPYTITWSTGSNADTLTGLAIGTYGFSIVDANGCSTTGFVNVDQGFQQAATLDVTDITCGNSNGAIDLTYNIQGINSYQWSTGDSTEDISGLAAGTYTVTITDGDFCVDVFTATVNDADGIDVVADRTDVDCNSAQNGGIDVSVTGGITPYSYAWSTTDTVQDLAGLDAGTYVVTVTDAGGCSASTSVLIVEPDVLTITEDSTYDVGCNGSADGAIFTTATGGTMPYTYVWSTGDSTDDITGLTVGSYTLTVTDANGCTVSSTLDVTEPDPLTLNVTDTDSVSCNGLTDGAATVTATGGTLPYTFEWSNGGSTSNTNSGLGAGNYWVIATDSNGCTSDTAFIEIIEPDVIVLDVQTENVACNGGDNGSISVFPSGGTAPFTFAWGAPLTGNGSAQNGLSAGTYTVTVTDANGCTEDETVVITEPDALVVTGDATNVFCIDSTDGVIIVSVTGGTQPYDIAWTDGANGDTRTDLAEGTYYAVVTDANQCVADTLEVFVGHNDCNNPPVAVDDTAQTREGTPIDIPVLDNDYDPDGDNIDVTGIVNDPRNGTTNVNSDGTITYTPDDGFIGVDTFTYVICDDGVPSLCDTADVIVVVLPDRPNIKIPNSFSPNGDGLNDNFEIVDITKFPDNELLIFNRWGNEVYRAAPYNNDWNGRNQDGDPLPDGTYFYILKVNDSNNTPPYTGYVVIHRGSFK